MGPALGDHTHLMTIESLKTSILLRQYAIPTDTLLRGGFIFIAEPWRGGSNLGPELLQIDFMPAICLEVDPNEFIEDSIVCVHATVEVKRVAQHE